VKSTVLVSITILISISLFAQTDPSRPSFEAASIRPFSDPGPASEISVGIRHIPGSPRIDMSGVTLKMLMAYAYSARESQIAGGPGWIDSERYVIQAIAKDGDESSPMQLRVQSLLEDRFGLKLHRETRETPAYELAMADASKLKLSADQTCAAAS
jgi:uncharacterized protein (TIGR03435 family)